MMCGILNGMSDKTVAVVKFEEEAAIHREVKFI